jgi:hypothetical protein
LDEKHFEKLLKKLPQITVTTDPKIATHCITTPQLVRTPKLMQALNSVLKYVLTEDWLKDSAKAGRPISIVDNEDRFTTAADYAKELAKSKYIIGDVEKEALWGFDMTRTLATIKFGINDAGERVGSRIFIGIAVVCTKGVCGVKAPSDEEMQEIIESGGGIWCKTIADYRALTAPGGDGGAGTAGKKGKKRSAVEVEAPVVNSLLIVSHASVAKKELKKEHLDAAKASGALGIYAVEAIFCAIIRQQLDIHEDMLEGYIF